MGKKRITIQGEIGYPDVKDEHYMYALFHAHASKPDRTGAYNREFVRADDVEKWFGTEALQFMYDAAVSGGKQTGYYCQYIDGVQYVSRLGFDLACMYHAVEAFREDRKRSRAEWNAARRAAREKEKEAARA